MPMTTEENLEHATARLLAVEKLLFKLVNHLNLSQEMIDALRPEQLSGATALQPVTREIRSLIQALECARDKNSESHQQ